MIKSIVPRSFEKTFDGLAMSEIVAGFRFCVQGLTQAQLNVGLDKIKQMGYCPDPAMFAKWCKGLDGFDNAHAISDGYVDKHAALHRLEKWLADPSQPITVAIKQAYDATYQAWRDIHSANDRTKAELAFKGEYQAIVSQLVRDGVQCQEYQSPIAIAVQASQQPHIAASDEFVEGVFAKLRGRA